MTPSLVHLLDAQGLKLVSGWFSGRLLEGSIAREKERMERQLATFKALGAPVMVYAETTGSVQTARQTPVSRRPRLAADAFKEYGARLTALAEYMTERGVAMTYHHHMGTIVESDAEIDLLMAHTGAAVGLLVDTGHITYAGGDYLAVTRRHGARLNHVHCKDVRPAVLAQAREEDWSFLDAVVAGVFTAPGDGSVDFAAFARLLQAVGGRTQTNGPNRLSSTPEPVRGSRQPGEVGSAPRQVDRPLGFDSAVAELL